MKDSLLSSLKELVSSQALVPEEALGSWAWNGGRPRAVVAPGSVEELATVLGRASQEGWKVVPAGLGSWMEGGGMTAGDLVLSTSRLQEMELYEPGDLTFTAQGGTPMATLEAATRAQGQWLPLDPPGSRKGSLGALAALGQGGPLRAGFGTPRDHILGVTLVSGDGRLLRWGGRVVKNVAGFDMTRLSIGSWGTLGVITSVSARLFPLPEEDVTLVFPGSSGSSLLPAGRAMAISPLPLASVELLDPLGEMDGLGGSPRVPPTPGASEGAALLLRVLGPGAQVRTTVHRIMAELGGEVVGEPLRFAGEESLALSRSLNAWEEGGELVLRMALLPSKLDVLFQESERLALELGASVGGFPGEGGTPTVRLSAHVTAGILRVVATGLPDTPDGLDPWASALTSLRARLEEDGGSLAVSRGPRTLLEDVGAWGEPGGERRILKGLKDELDPQGILAPGRFVV